VDITHLTYALERRTNIVCRRAERQIPHIQSLTHVALSLPAPRAPDVPNLLSPVERSPCPRGARRLNLPSQSRKKIHAVALPEIPSASKCERRVRAKRNVNPG
jgi:hypothetical protein